MITAAPEEPVDYEVTARIATDAFRARRALFYPEQLKWFYERAFSHGTTLITLRDGHRKIGQCAMVHQLVLMDTVCEHGVQLVDLFVVEGFRSREVLKLLYDE